MPGKRRPRQRDYMLARSRAITRLRDAHLDEWIEIYGEERVKVGLPENPDPKYVMRINHELRERIEELERQVRTP